MSHPRLDRIDLYLEGELAGTERAELEAHLAACPACRLELEDRRLLDLAVSGLRPVEVPDGFADAVMARLPGARRGGVGRVVAALAGTAAVLGSLLGYYLATGQGLAGFLGAAWRAWATLLGLAVRLAAKGFDALRVLLGLVKEFGPAVIHGFGILPPLLKAEIAGAALVLGLTVFGLAVLGVRQISALGGRS
ncbi:MAG TPA: anti-sigma factor [Terriglobales bacterium]|nr:anti-sigma factor [Terriglobales bacterium]